MSIGDKLLVKCGNQRKEIYQIKLQEKVILKIHFKKVFAIIDSTDLPYLTPGISGFKKAIPNFLCVVGSMFNLMSLFIFLIFTLTSSVVLGILHICNVEGNFQFYNDHWFFFQYFQQC